MDFTGFREVVQKAQAGDRLALDRLQEMLEPYVRKLAREHTAQPDPMESTRDLVHDVWVRFFQKLPQFRGAEATSDDTQAGRVFCGWLRLLANSTLHNANRNHSRHHPRNTQALDARGNDGSSRGRAIDPEGRDARPSQHAIAGEKQRAGLDPVEREMVRLRVDEGLNWIEIAVRLGLTEHELRLHKQMIRERLAND